MYKDEQVGPIRRGVRKILRAFVSQFDNDTERVLWLVIGAALKRRALTLAMLLGNLLAAVFEGGSLGILVLAVTVIMEPDKTEGLSSLGTIGEFLAPVFGPLGREATFLVLVSMGVVTQIIRAGLQYGATCASVYLTTSTQVALQERLIRHINAMTYQEINRHPSGEFTAYMDKTGTVSNLLLTINQIILNTMLCLAYVVLMLWISWQVALAALAAVAVFSGLVSVLILRIREYGRMLAKFSLKLGKHTMEYLQAPRLIRTFSREEDISRRWSEIINDQMVVKRKGQLLQNLLSPLLDTLTIVLSGIIIIGGFYLFQGERQDILPVLLSFVVVLNRMMTRVTSLNKSRSNISHLMPSAQMLAQMLRTDDKEMIESHGIDVPQLTNSIIVQGVYFSYKGTATWVLRDINLEIMKGDSIAIVGSSGAGKTTLLDLLLGLYSPTMGAIMIDGIDVKEADPSSWRKQFCVVEQEPFFFNQSIKENLMFVNPEVSESELMDALGKAYIKDFVLSLSDQLDTVIGNRGYRLSGGQLQRLAIARAFLAEGNVIVFDEATSDLDSISESYIKDSVRAIKGYKTIVTVAHRLSTVAESDCIVVMKEGCIVDQGAHDTLLSRCIEYRELWKLQTAGKNRVEHADWQS